MDSRQVYLGARLPVALSSRQKPRFLPAVTQLMSDKSAAGDFCPVNQTEKLSPQPHSPFTLGLRKRKASFSPCFTKSTCVPSMSDKL
jgi:hypothetical protein